MDTKTTHQSKILGGVLIGVSSIIVLLFVFKAGVIVGYHKASFSSGLGDNYYRVFDRRGPGQGSSFFDDLPGGHGTVGTIVKIQLPFIVVAGTDNVEKTVRIDGLTDIRRFKELATSSDLMVGDMVVVVGNPNEKAEVVARFMRVVPSILSTMASSSVASTSSRY